MRANNETVNVKNGQKRHCAQNRWNNCASGYNRKVKFKTIRTMTTTMTITLLIITAASIALNVFQFMERRIEKKEVNKLVADGALLEQEHQKLTAVYNNEKLHKEWAIGRIKDQQAVIDQLKSNIMFKKAYRPRKEVRND